MFLRTNKLLDDLVQRRCGYWACVTSLVGGILVLGIIAASQNGGNNTASHPSSAAKDQGRSFENGYDIIPFFVLVLFFGLIAWAAVWARRVGIRSAQAYSSDLFDVTVAHEAHD